MPHIKVTMFEGRTQAQKKAVAEGFMRILEETLGSKPEHTWIFFEDKSFDSWFTGGESQSEINAHRKTEVEVDND